MKLRTSAEPEGLTVMTIDRDRMRMYQQHARPASLRRAIRRLDAVAGDLDILEEMGDAEAITGALVLLREAAFDVMAVPVKELAKHERKLAAIHQHFAVAANPPWLMEAALGAAIRTEWDILDITPEDEERLRETMPRSRIG